MKKGGTMVKLIDKEENRELATIHTKIFDPSPLRGHLIYYDRNFALYLQDLLQKSDKDFFFGYYNDSSLKGFVHLKEIGDSIFLNNFFVDPDIRGKGEGKRFLFETLSEIANLIPKKYFELDVFDSNSKVKDWYKNIGMNEVGRRYWYKDQDITNDHKKKEEFVFRNKDQNGFISYFLGNKKIATEVNSTTILVHGIEYIDFFRSFVAKTIIIICREFLEIEEFELVDISIRMRAPLDVALNNLR